MGKEPGREAIENTDRARASPWEASWRNNDLAFDFVNILARPRELLAS